MFHNNYKFSLSFCILFFLSINLSFGDIVKKIEITGNERISTETIIMFSKISENDDLKIDSINKVLKNIYDSNFFKDVSVNFDNNILSINVEENPIIESVEFSGIKAQRIRDKLVKSLLLKSRTSFNEFSLKQDKENIINTLKNLGFYFPNVEIFIEDLNDNKIKLKYNITLGKKSKIRKITFIGNKVFKDNKLRSIIVSEEYKFWKFISGKKYLNENMLELDKRLLKNFYLSKGYYGVDINSSFAKLIKNDQFELIFNISANNKIFFDNINLTIPDDFNSSNFTELEDLFKELKGKPYSINSVNIIL